MFGVQLSILFMMTIITAISASTQRKLSSTECFNICTKTGYHGMIGPCNCGLIVFAGKRVNQDDDKVPRNLIRKYKILQRFNRHFDEPSIWSDTN
uniref:Venom protein n=1 Tax=Hadrurus spadix TaxID=141984 RepID=A0A1W7R988_9SCOR